MGERVVYIGEGKQQDLQMKLLEGLREMERFDLMTKKVQQERSW